MVGLVQTVTCHAISKNQQRTSRHRLILHLAPNVTPLSDACYSRLPRGAPVLASRRFRLRPLAVDCARIGFPRFRVDWYPAYPSFRPDNRTSKAVNLTALPFKTNIFGSSEMTSVGP